MREEEKKRTSQNSNWQRLMKKRWVFPAIYLASAALILTAVLMFQAGNQTETDPADDTNVQGPSTSYNNDGDAVEVNRPVENFVMPVTDEDSAIVEKQFWDENASEEDQEASFLYYNNAYHPNTGIDIVMQNGETFDVVASLSGTVTRVEEDTLLGTIVEIEHLDGVKTVYQALTDVTVKESDYVEQGQKIAKAGTSLVNPDSVHVHFEIRKDSVAVNPQSYFNKPVTALIDQEGQTSEESTNPAGEQEDAPAEGEDKPEDGEDKDGDEGSSEEEDENSVSYQI